MDKKALVEEQMATLVKLVRQHHGLPVKTPVTRLERCVALVKTLRELGLSRERAVKAARLTYPA